jgi:tetratricopeptide (TPR) repeat protein
MGSGMQRFFYCTCITAMLISGCGTLPVSQDGKVFNEAVALYKNGDCRQACLKFTEALQKDSDLREGYVYLAECSLQQGDLEAALKSAQQAMAGAAGGDDSRRRLKAVLAAGGQKACDAGEFDLSILFSKEAVALDPNDSLRLLLGTAILGRGGADDMRSAVAEFKIAVSTSATPAQDTELIRSVMFARAEQFASQGDMYGQSRCYLAYAENFNTSDAEAYMHIGRLLSRIGNPVGALHYAKRAYALDPGNKAAIKFMYELNSPVQH